MTRRQALAVTGKASLIAASFDPVRVLLGSMVDGIIQNAQAASTGVKPRNYVHISLAGGPQRWAWDLPLNPYEPASSLLLNPGVITGFADAGTNAGAAQYRTVSVTRAGETLNMPQMWAGPIPIVGGGTVPMANLLDNMLMMRGVNMLQDGHPNNQGRQIRPAASAPSLGGRVADNSEVPVAAVAMGYAPYKEHKSEKGIGQVFYEGALDAGENPLYQVLKPFNSAPDGLPGTFVSRRDALDISIKKALASLGTYANSNNPGASELFSLAGKSETLLRQGIGNVSAEFGNLRAKYAALIASCRTLRIPGVTDKPILPANYSNDFLNVDAGVLQNPDLRDIIGPNGDIRFMAGSFAVIEYLLTRNYSSSIMTGWTAVNNLNMIRNAGAQSGWMFDEHGGGAIGSAIVNAFMFQALSACLYELISVLKTNGLFGETVIHIAGEFSRAPKADGRGSEHGWRGSCATVISGAIKKPLVLGNTKYDYGDGDATYEHRGSWGAAAKVNIEGSDRELTIGHVASAISQVLKVDSIVPNDSSLVLEPVIDGGIQPTIEKGKTKPS